MSNNTPNSLLLLTKSQRYNGSIPIQQKTFRFNGINLIKFHIEYINMRR